MKILQGVGNHTIEYVVDIQRLVVLVIWFGESVLSWNTMNLHSMGCFMGIMLCSPPLTILEDVNGWTDSCSTKRKSAVR